MNVKGRVLGASEAIWVEVGATDPDGKDRIVAVAGPFPLRSSEQSLGASILGALRLGRESTADTIPWKQVLRTLGFASERSLVAAVDCIFVWGTIDQKLVLQPCVREKGVFVGANDAYIQELKWDPHQVGVCTAEVLARIRRGEVSVDGPSDSAPARPPSEAATFFAGQRVWHLVRQSECRIVSIDPDDEHGLGRITLEFADGTRLSVTAVAPGIRPLA